MAKRCWYGFVGALLVVVALRHSDTGPLFAWDSVVSQTVWNETAEDLNKQTLRLRWELEVFVFQPQVKAQAAVFPTLFNQEKNNKYSDAHRKMTPWTSEGEPLSIQQVT